MKSVYILLITTVFEITTQVYAMPADIKEASQRTLNPSNIKPDQVYFRDNWSATTPPTARYLSRQIPQSISNLIDQNIENTESKINVDEDTNKIRRDIQQEMIKTRSQLKLNAENAQARMDQFLESSRNALQQNWQMEYEDMIKDVAIKISSLRDQREAFNSEIQSTMQQLRQEIFNRIRQMNLDFSKAIQLNNKTIAQFHQDFSAQWNSLVKNMQQQKMIGLEKLKSQFNSILDELGTKVEQNHSQVFGLQEQVKQNVRNQIRDIFNEMMEKAKAIVTDMRNIYAERKQNLMDVYKKAQTMDGASAKEYVNQEMESVTAEMNQIKAEMEQKMINEIKKVINMLRTEVDSIMP